MPIDIDPVEVAVDMLREAIPGFATRIDPSTDSISIRGALPIAAGVSQEAVRYPIYGRPVFMDVEARRLMDATENAADRRIRHARQRERITEELKPMVRQIVETIQRNAIEAVNLEPVIGERERVAKVRGEREGYDKGRAAGIREGYDNGVRSIVRILLQGDGAIGDAVDAVRAEWGDEGE